MIRCFMLSILIVVYSGFSNAQNTVSSVFKGKPQINGPEFVGHYPETPFVYTIPTSGERPLKWSIKNLPKGLMLDKNNGIITGKAPREGQYILDVTVKNKLGIDNKKIVLEVGKTLALTPPMGWNSWNTFASTVNEQLIKEIADYMVSSGMRDLGYQYVNIDDFWQLKIRDADGNIQINKEKFPNGIKALADYIHSKGLKIGIYSDAAEKTCGGVAGSYGYEEQDAKLFASWGIDLLKYDYCNAPVEKDSAIIRYARMAKALKATGCSIYFSVCEWGVRKPWEWAGSIGGNSWRTTRDIFDVWDYNKGHNGVIQIINANSKLWEYAKPGNWNDPDMLIVGIRGKGKATSGHDMKNIATGLTDEEYKTHMSLWSLMAAPLLCGNDLRNMDDFTRTVLMNKEIIAINQDGLGKQARVISDQEDKMVFAKELRNGKWAIGLFNRDGANVQEIDLNISAIGLSGKIKVRDIWKHEDIGIISNRLSFKVPPHGCTVLLLSK
ncbi:MAG: alpha-galactosidase [Niabella sp.]